MDATEPTAEEREKAEALFRRLAESARRVAASRARLERWQNTARLLDAVIESRKAAQAEPPTPPASE